MGTTDINSTCGNSEGTCAVPTTCVRVKTWVCGTCYKAGDIVAVNDIYYQYTADSCEDPALASTPTTGGMTFEGLIASLAPEPQIWTIGANSNWFLNGVDSGMPSVGEDGTSAVVYTVGANGNWFADGVDTGNPATGPSGADGTELVFGVGFSGTGVSGDPIVMAVCNLPTATQAELDAGSITIPACVGGTTKKVPYEAPSNVCNVTLLTQTQVDDATSIKSVVCLTNPDGSTSEGAVTEDMLGGGGGGDPSGVTGSGVSCSTGVVLPAGIYYVITTIQDYDSGSCDNNPSSDKVVHQGGLFNGSDAGSPSGFCTACAVGGSTPIAGSFSYTALYLF